MRRRFPARRTTNTDHNRTFIDNFHFSSGVTNGQAAHWWPGPIPLHTGVVYRHQ
jgi:hypothetical protein